MKPLPEHILLRTKHIVPVQRQKLIVRPRLIETLQLAAEARLISLNAPAGFGKTTLLGQWAAKHHGPIGWLSLDERDDDLNRFWRYVLQAIIHAAPQPERYELLHRLLPAASIDLFIDALINELCGEADSLLLVWDDFHFIQSAVIHGTIFSFIDRLPDTVRLIIGSRTELQLPAAKWIARGEYISLDARRLQFTLEETAAFCEQTAKIPLSATRIQRFQQRTEGWAAALQLLSMSMHSEADYERIMTSYNGGNEAVENFLIQEVLAGLPGPLREFVQRTSILDRMDAALCEAVTGRADGTALLEQLKADNLFIIPLDEQGTWFRYHQLFAEALQSRLRRSDPVGLLDSHRRAALHLSDRGFHSAAISHAIAAEDTALTERLLAKHAEVLLKLGEFTILLRWLDSFPARSHERQPETALLHAFVLVASGQPQRAEEIVDHVEAQLGELAHEDGSRFQQLQSGMLFVKSNLLYASGRFEQWMRFASSGLHHMLPHNSIYYSFNYNLTEPLVRYTAFGIKGVITKEMEQIAHLFTRTLSAHNWNDSLINLYVLQTLGEGYYEWNRLEEAAALLRDVDRAAREHAVPGLLVPNRIVQAMLYQANGQFYLAHDTIDEAITLLGAMNVSASWIRNLQACRARLYTLEGRLGAARKELTRLQIALGDRPLLSRYYEYMALIRLLSAQRKLMEALRLVRLLLPQAVRENSLIHIIELTLVEAGLEELLGQRAKALIKLQEALALTQPSGYIRSYLDEGEPMLGLLQLTLSQLPFSEPEPEPGEPQGISADYSSDLEPGAPQEISADYFSDSKPGAPQGISADYSSDSKPGAPQGISADYSSDSKPGARQEISADYVRALIAQFPGKEQEPKAAQPPAALTQSELGLLSLIGQGASNKQIAARLALSEGTVKVYLSRIYSKLDVSSRTQALLAARRLGLLERE
jgi:LuxR family maltose regulon positive regulatory protein